MELVGYEDVESRSHETLASLVVHLISNEQIHMIIKDHTRYDSDKYKELERLKVKIKDVKEDAG